MQTILEYIMLNYTWFLVAAIIILLAIIGSYADKTNFGQGKDKKEINQNTGFNQNKLLSETLKQEQPVLKSEKISEQQNENNITQQTANKIVESQKVLMNKTDDLEENNSNLDNVERLEENNSNLDNVERLEEKFSEFDKEFDALLPKKDILDVELLDEINDLSLDKTQKINLTDIPDLDDVDLPKIRSLNSIDEDIWKF